MFDLFTYTLIFILLLRFSKIYHFFICIYNILIYIYIYIYRCLMFWVQGKQRFSMLGKLGIVPCLYTHSVQYCSMLNYTRTDSLNRVELRVLILLDLSQYQGYRAQSAILITYCWKANYWIHTILKSIRKWKQPRPGYELKWLYSFPVMLIIKPRALIYIYIVYIYIYIYICKTTGTGTAVRLLYLSYHYFLACCAGG